ncbi:methionine biosynthesis protein MetW [Hansschlegelia beijingensis]
MTVLDAASPVPAETLAAAPRPDHLLVAEMVQPGSRVLDVGCGDGALLRLLIARRGVDGRGIEISQSGVNASVAHGLSVVQGDADADLAHYPDDAFDYVILSQTLQATRRPKAVVEDLLRIGRRAIVSFPNFGHWRVRMQFLLEGRMPQTANLPDPWYETPNIHLCTIRDLALQGDQTREYATNVRAEVLPGCGHWLPEECAGTLNPMVVGFLAAK